MTRRAGKSYKATQSAAHLWDAGYPVTRCVRCGAHFSYRGMDSRGPIECHPTPAWLRSHPESVTPDEEPDHDAHMDAQRDNRWHANKGRL